jgi:hypothetical protein
MYSESELNIIPWLNHYEQTIKPNHFLKIYLTLKGAWYCLIISAEGNAFPHVT